MSLVKSTPQVRELTRFDVLRTGMRVAIVSGLRSGRSKTVHVGTVVQVFGDGAHVEYDYDPGRRHLHLSENMVEVLGGPLAERQDEPFTVRRPATNP